jgi:1-deoxy-D-xylulose-5-phosphate reductoisomerase
MGPKVTIDSATLANKGYEVVETHWLYGLPYDRIEVVLHPESVVHAMVELIDGSVVAQIAEPDMRLPIQYALLWEHEPSTAPRFEWTRKRELHFGEVDLERYPCFAHVLATARGGDQGAMIGLSAADEIAVARFLAGGIKFTEIAGFLRRGAELGAGAGAAPALDEIAQIDARVKHELQPAEARA